MSEISAQLIQRCIQQDDEAFENLVHLLSGRIHRFIYRMVRNRTLAEDLAQETFVRLYFSMGKFDPERGNIKTWTYTIARNLCIDHIRRQRRWVRVDTEDGQDPLLDFVATEERTAWDELEQSQLADLVRRAIDKLPQDIRLPFLLVQQEDLSYEEAASVCGCKLGTFKSRIFRAKQILQKEIERMSGERL